MQSIHNIVLEANAIRASSSDNDVQVLAELIQQLAIRLQDVEALAETNANSSQRSRPVDVAPRSASIDIKLSKATALI